MNNLKFLILFYFISIFTMVPPLHANTGNPSCTRLLGDRFTTNTAKALQNVAWDFQYAEQAISLMKEKGELTTDNGEDRIRAQLQLGAMFINEGLLHEAVYLIFKDRYGSNQEIADAINGFKNMSDEQNMQKLLNDVMERVLQFIPDVDIDNVNQIREISEYLNMNEDQMASFRNKWLVFDQMNQFSDIMLGGIYSVMMSPTPEFIKNVVKRGSLKYGWARLRHGIKIPMAPRGDITVKLKQINIEDREFYKDFEIENYLNSSSSAARRFFILEQMHFMTTEQLRWILGNAKDLFLSNRLIQQVTNEIHWRVALKNQNDIIKILAQDKTEIEFSLARISNQEPYDLNLFQKRINALRQFEKAQQVRTEAIQILQDYQNKVDTAKYINIVSSIINAVASQLNGKHKEVMDIIKEMIRTANLIGLKDEHILKLKKVIMDFATNSGKSAHLADDALRDLVIRSPKYISLSESDLQARMTALEKQIQAANIRIQETFDNGPDLH